MCDKCENGLIEVDPRNPRQASSPQYQVCECMEEEAQYLEDTAYDDYEDN